MPKTIVFTDIDNTLYDWPAFYAPSFRAMLHALGRALEISEDQLYMEFKEVYSRQNSLEYPFAIQELKSIKDFEQDKIDHFVKQGRGAFNRTQRKRLIPYPNVEETLKWCNYNGISVIGVTNSPMYLAQKRLYNLKLDKFLDGLVAWDGVELQTNNVNSKFVPKFGERKKSRIPRLVNVKKYECKPNVKHYQLAMENFSDDSSVVYVVGDSFKKDLLPAAKIGLTTVWAKYGAGIDRNDLNEATLLKITNWSENEIQSTFSMTDFKADIEIDSFDKLMKFLPGVQQTLF